jgi:hypothetical protein
MKYELVFKNGSKLQVSGKGITKAVEAHIVCDKPCENDKIDEYLNSIDYYTIIREAKPMQAITQDEYLKLSIEDRRMAEDIYSDLSPENLTCDGELPSRYVTAKANRIHKALDKLQKRIDRIIPEELVYDNLLPFEITNKLHFNSWD